MEFTKPPFLGVKLSKSVIVKGDKNTSETDCKLFESLTKDFGPIEKIFPVDDPVSIDHKNLIVEFKDDSNSFRATIANGAHRGWWRGCL